MVACPKFILRRGIHQEYKGPRSVAIRSYSLRIQDGGNLINAVEQETVANAAG